MGLTVPVNTVMFRKCMLSVCWVEGIRTRTMQTKGPGAGSRKRHRDREEGEMGMKLASGETQEGAGT